MEAMVKLEYHDFKFQHKSFVATLIITFNFTFLMCASNQNDNVLKSHGGVIAYRSTLKML
jgi:hypothetical protein